MYCFFSAPVCPNSLNLVTIKAPGALSKYGQAIEGLRAMDTICAN